MARLRTLSLAGVMLALAAGGWCPSPRALAAQDASGRPTTTSQDPSGRPKIRKTGKPKKVIRATSETDKEPSASVIIRSYPPIAEVSVDGVVVGTTADDGELELAAVRLGLHKIVLKKDGYKEWGQTVILRTTADKVEIEPLLQSETAQFVRDKSKMQPVPFGKEIPGQISRDGLAMRDGGFYNEYMLHVDEPDAFVVSLKSKSGPLKIRIVDDSNTPFSLEPVSPELYHSAFIPTAGDYFLQVIGAVDEASFTAADYTLVVLPERQAHSDLPITIGETASGTLESTDRLMGQGDYYDGWTFSGQAGLAVKILVQTNGGFAPAVTLLLDGKVVASSNQPAKDKKKKKGPEPANDTAQITTTLTGGSYTLIIRSQSGPKQGPYQLSILMGG